LGHGLLNRGTQGGQPGLVRGSHSKLSVSVTLLARGRGPVPQGWEASRRSPAGRTAGPKARS